MDITKENNIQKTNHQTQFICFKKKKKFVPGKEGGRGRRRGQSSKILMGIRDKRGQKNFFHISYRHSIISFSIYLNSALSYNFYFSSSSSSSSVIHLINRIPTQQHFHLLFHPLQPFYYNLSVNYFR